MYLISLYDKLLDIDVNGNLIPELAESWTVSLDVTSITFSLREDVRFHDGSPLTSDDVKFNLEKDVELFPGLIRTSLIDNGKILEVIEVDDTTFQIILPSPDLGILETLAGLDGMIASRLALESTGSGETGGAGPFKFVKFATNAIIELEAFSDYWAGLPLVNTIDFLEIPEEATRLAALLTGEIDAMTGQDSGTFDILSGSNDFIVCGSKTNFHAVSVAATGFECFPDVEMRFENVSGLGIMGIGVPNFEQ